MQLYIYAKSGHNFGLENVRRACAVFNMLKDTKPVLCTSDYRAATFAKYNLGANRGVGVDVIGNMPHAMERGDMLIYDDSGEASQTMQSHMEKFCTHLYKIGEDIPKDIVDLDYFNSSNHTIKKAVSFADDDYANWFFDFVKDSKRYNLPLLLGHYFFLGNEDILKNHFSKLYEDEEYKEIVCNTTYLLTASVHTALESLAAGNNPIFFIRKDKEYIDNTDLLEKYNIPTIKGDNFDQLIDNFEKQITNYPEVKKIEPFDISKIEDDIKQTIKKFERIKPSLEYKY